MNDLRDSKPLMNPEDMWSVMNSDVNHDWGVIGYEAPKIYFDHKKIKKDRETYELHQAVWAKKRHYPKPKVSTDKDGNPVIPTKLNFIDEWIKMSNANFSKEKFEKYVEFLKEKGKSLEEVEGVKKAPEEKITDKNKAKFYKHDRSTYIGEIFKSENKKYAIPPDFQEIVDKAKERQGRYTSPQKSESELMKIKYNGKSSLSKGDRLTFLAESEFVGEKLPFYNTKPEENEEGGSEDDKKKKKNQKNLFFPNINPTIKSSPKWKMHKPAKIDMSYLERKEEIINGKIENLRKSWEDKRIKFIDDVSVSYFNLHSNRNSYKYHKPTEKSDQYKTAKEQSPSKYPGPQAYFKTPIMNFHSKSPQKNSEESAAKDEEGSPKIYYMNRDKTDKRLYKPMKSYVF